MKPMRNIITLAVDHQHILRPLPDPSSPFNMALAESIDFCVIKRSSIALFTLRERLTLQKVS
jgi:hypothetical protein